MSNRAIVTVATGDHFVSGQERLIESFAGEEIVKWTNRLPDYSPSHRVVPYGFKAWALKAAAVKYQTLLWMDSCMVAGERPLNDLWEKIEHDGYFLMSNAPWTNYEWTADSAYQFLFPELDHAAAREQNKKIVHVIGGVIGFDLRSAIGQVFLDEFLRLAQTDAFRGPSINLNWRDENGKPHEWADKPWASLARCGPADVRGHRHDQVGLSVIAWRLRLRLGACPEWFSYWPGRAETCVVAKGI